MKIGTKKLALAILGCTCLSAPAHAGNFYGFGDSLVDNGNIPKLTGIDYPPPPYSQNRFSNGEVWAQYFPGLTGLGFTASNDYGVGGAFAGPLSVGGTTYNNLENLPASLGEPGFAMPLPSFLSEVQEFAATGAHFGASDVVGVWVGANDYFATLSEVNAGLANPATAIPAAISLVATQTATGVAELNALGAQRFIIFTLPALGDTPLFNTSGAATIALADEISAGHDLALSYAMAESHAATGANIIVINQAQLFSELLADPAAYGKTNVTDACITTPSCVAASTAVQNQYLFWDSVHPTTGTHLIIAEYAANALNGLGGLAAAAQIGAAGANAFATQLDTRTAALAAGASGFSVDLPGQGAGQLGNTGKLSGFFSGSYDFGTHKTIGADNGFTYNLASFAFGVDDQLAPGVAAGGAIGYGNDHGNITQDGSLSANAFQLGGYVSFYRPAYYLNIDLAYGFDAYSTSRPGVVSGPITGHPGGNTISLGGQTGYVLNAGPLTYGPIAGLRATDASLNSYAEHGDAALTQYVDAQSYNQVIGDIGAAASATLAAGRLSLHPHATITLDQLLSGNGGSFTSNFTDEPIVSLTTTDPKASHTWATLAAGLSTSLTPRLSASLDLATTFAKSDSEDHSISATLRARF